MPSPKESGLWVAFYVALALVFAGMMFAFVGPDGRVTEYPDLYWDLVERAEGHPIPRVDGGAAMACRRAAPAAARA